MRRVACLMAWLARGTPRPDARRPTFVFLVGVEGSSHHGVAQNLVWPLVRDHCGPKCAPPRTIDDLDDDGSESIYRVPSECNATAYDEDVRSRLYSVPSQAVREGGAVRDVDGLRRRMAAAPRGSYFFEWRSFPSAGHTQVANSSDRQPPLPLDLAALARALDGVARLRLLVLQRDFRTTVLSHNRWDKGTHAVVIERHLRSLAQQLEHLAGDAAVLPVDCLYDHASKATRRSVVENLRTFLDAPDSSCCECFAFWRASRDHRRPGRSPIDAIAALERDHAPDWGPFARMRAPGFRYLLDPESCRAPAES